MRPEPRKPNIVVLVETDAAGEGPVVVDTGAIGGPWSQMTSRVSVTIYDGTAALVDTSARKAHFGREQARLCV